MKIIIIALISCCFLLSGCALFDRDEVYYGVLETDQVRLSAQAAGMIKTMAVEEGDAVNINQVIAAVDTTQLELQRQQVAAELALSRQLLASTAYLVRNDAVPSRQQDEVQTRVNVLQSRLDSMVVQIRDAVVRSPITGVILNTYVHKGELVQPGILIAEVANLTTLETVIYLPLNRLPDIRIGQRFALRADGMEKDIPATVIHIADEAEFTPKTVLTEEARTRLVYAVRLKVPNPDQSLKIGMPVEARPVEE